jgi:hypothetical protein
MVMKKDSFMEAVSIVVQHSWNWLDPVVDLVQKHLNAIKKICWPVDCFVANVPFVWPKSQKPLYSSQDYPYSNNVIFGEKSIRGF